MTFLQEPFTKRAVELVIMFKVDKFYSPLKRVS